ncbi:hypothetical protein V8C86DRAFT_2523053 [Haematococcus lacustris]
MMTPENMKAAMEALKHIPPDQLSKMMGSMTPEMMAQAQSMAAGMSAADMQRAQEQMKNMSADDLQRATTQATAQLSAQQQYVLTASQQLKAEGNALHSAGKFKEAVEKYERAKSNVAGHSNTTSQELRTACTLNLSSCYLNLKDWAKCIAQCNEVLQGDPSSLKALYRRGQALLGSGQWAQATEDLAQAVRLSSHDPTQQALIRDKLQEAKDQLSAQRATSGYTSTAVTNQATITPRANLDSSSAAVQRCTVEEIVEGAGGSGSAAASGAGPAVSADMYQRTAELMRKNPDWAKQLDSVLPSMSDEQLHQLTSSMGAPMTRQQLQASRRMMEGMEPQQLDAMMKMQAALPPDLLAKLACSPQDPAAVAEAVAAMQRKPEVFAAAQDMVGKMNPEQLKAFRANSGCMPNGAAGPSTSTSAGAVSDARPGGSRSLTPGPPGVPGAAAAGDLAAMMTPEMMKMAADMMSSLPPEQLQAMTAGLGAGPGAGLGSGLGGAGPGMPALTPELAKAAADMMSKMSPEDMQSMAAMMGAGPSGAASGRLPGLSASGQLPGDMMSRMNDPGMMEAALKMMKGMDKASMASMMQASGLVKSQAQAEAMVDQMQGMSDTQLKMMVKAATVVQSGARVVSRAKEFLYSRPLLVAALLVLLLAVLLRWLGVM